MRIRKNAPSLAIPCELTPAERHSLMDLKVLLEALPDPRQQSKLCFPLAGVLLISFCAMLSGCDHFTDFALFAQAQLPWLRTFLPLPNGAPSHDVFRNVFMALKPQLLLEIMAQWAGPSAGRRLIIDGKCLRGTNQGRQGAAAKVFLLRAWAKQSGLTIGQVACGEKAAELTVLPELLSALELTGTIVSIDAMGTHPEIAQQIHEQGADYVLALKKNQPKAYAEVAAHFARIGKIDPATPTAPLPAAPPGHHREETVEYTHGRYQHRILTTTAQFDWFTRDWKWHGLKSITEVRRLTHRNTPREALTEEVHYYLSSLPADAPSLAKIIREHWAVENSCHYVLDVTYREDHCQVQDANAAQNLSLLREMTAKALRDSPLKGSIASKRLRACLDPVFRLKTALSAFTSLFQA